MSQPSEKPPSVSKALNEKLGPQLTALGFSKQGNKRYARLSGDIVQFLCIGVRQSEFVMEFSSMFLPIPTNFIDLSHGGRFPLACNGRWFSARNEKALQSSLELVMLNFPPLVAWFEASFSAEDFLKSYLLHLEGEYPAHRENGHTEFTLAACYARKNEIERAHLHLEAAIRQFQGSHEHFLKLCPGATNAWQPERIERCRELEAALTAGVHQILLDRWRAGSIAGLKLEKLT